MLNPVNQPEKVKTFDLWAAVNLCANVTRKDANQHRLRMFGADALAELVEQVEPLLSFT